MTPHNPYQTREDTPENREKDWRQNRVSEENRPRYKEMLVDLDNSVGAIVDKLEATGLAENTLVFFWSDNGDHNPENLDGINFADHLYTQEPLAKRDLFFGYEPKLGTALRRGQWKMILKGDDIQLYNLADDLKESTNVAAGHPEITASMRAAIEQFKETVVPGS